MLLIGGRAPNKILFSRATGRAWQTDLFPVYDATGLLERNEPVPFRLTRNLLSFFTPFGVDGVFVTVMACAAQVGGGGCLGRTVLYCMCACRAFRLARHAHMQLVLRTEHAYIQLVFRVGRSACGQPCCATV